MINLKKLFERLRKFQLKLNLIKCTFGATLEKLLGFVVNKKGIEIDLEKYEQYKTYLHLVLRKKLEVLWEGSTT